MVAKIGQTAMRINSTNVLSGIDSDGRYTVHGGRKGQAYRVLPANPPSPEEIKKIRGDAELTKKEFAETLGVSMSAVNEWERGTKVPDGVACRLFDIMRRDSGLIGKYVDDIG